jgi:glycosyltransferase involved in cell wall biosynthesis
MNKVLIVTYYWPPGSGAGVQRWLKFAKYLPVSGWEPVILTVDPAYAAYPVTDDTLSQEVSPDLKVFRTRATDWFRLYNRDKSKIPSAEGIRHVITTSPPHSTQLIGLALKKKHPGIFWIADLRDPWTDIYYYDSFYHTPLAKKIDAKYEKEVLLKADRIITVGKSLKEGFTSKIPGIGSKISIITNGYDEDDFSGIGQISAPVFTISYIGTLSDSYPVSGFMSTIEKLVNNGLSLKLRFVGSVSSGQKDLIMSKSGTAVVEFIPYVNHAEAVRFLMEASLLLLIIPNHHSNKSIITGKLFEYLASGKPILCIGPADGDAADIIETAGNGKCAGYSDTDMMREIIDRVYNERTTSGRKAPSEYSRASLTISLASKLSEI